MSGRTLPRRGSQGPMRYTLGSRGGTCVVFSEDEAAGSRTDFFSVMDSAQPDHRPNEAPATQYGQMRRQRVMKELRQGRPLAAEDMPVAAALVHQQRSRQRWFVPLWVLLAVCNILPGLSDPGFMRWVGLALTVCLLVAIPLQLREYRQLIRNYEGQQITPNVDDHRNDVAS